MKRFAKIATVSAATAAVATVGLVAVPGGDATAGIVHKYAQPASGAVSITSGTNEINVMVINRTDASDCTVTITRPDKKKGTVTYKRDVKLTALNQNTGIANFRGLFNKTTYTVSGTCEGTKVTSPETEDGAETAPKPETTEKVTTNLVGGDNKVAVRVDNSIVPKYDQCLQIVKGVSWDLGLRGAPLQTVMGIATSFCPR